MNKLYFIEISEMICSNIFMKLLSFVSMEKQEQISRFHYDVDKKLSLYAEILVRTVICESLSIQNNEIVFEKNEYGKPYLTAYPNFHFNLSHTRNAIAIAISNKPIGVDIERIKTADLRVAKRFFTEQEVDYITKLGINVDKHFCEVWTRKEAYIKYIGKGLSVPLNSFDVFIGNTFRHILTIEKNGYIISACSEYDNLEFNIIELPESDIEKRAMKILI